MLSAAVTRKLGAAPAQARGAGKRRQARRCAAQSEGDKESTSQGGIEQPKPEQEAPGPEQKKQEQSTVTATKKGGMMEAMAFSGWAPERLNGRLAMIGFMAAVGAELSTGETVLAQFKAYWPWFALTTGLFTLASFMPSLQGADHGSDPATMPRRKVPGPFNPEAELLNGRLAALGFVAMMVTETLKGGPLV